MSQETPRFVAPIMKNIERLADDAALLRDAYPEKAASCCMAVSLVGRA